MYEWILTVTIIVVADQFMGGNAITTQPPRTFAPEQEQECKDAAALARGVQQLTMYDDVTESRIPGPLVHTMAECNRGERVEGVVLDGAGVPTIVRQR